MLCFYCCFVSTRRHSCEIISSCKLEEDWIQVQYYWAIIISSVTIHSLSSVTLHSLFNVTIPGWKISFEFLCHCIISNFDILIVSIENAILKDVKFYKLLIPVSQETLNCPGYSVNKSQPLTGSAVWEVMQQCKWFIFACKLPFLYFFNYMHVTYSRFKYSIYTWRY